MILKKKTNQFLNYIIIFLFFIFFFILGILFHDAKLAYKTKQIILKNKIVINNFMKKFKTNDMAFLQIDIPFKSLKTLEDVEKKANKVNNLKAVNNVYVPASISFQNRTIKTNVRLKGMTNFHRDTFRKSLKFSLKRLKNGKAQIVKKDNHFFSRIHVDDIANVLLKSLEKFKNKEIYNICDDKPAPQSEVAAYGAKLLKIDQK